MAKLFPLHLYRVSGNSMLPTYKPGELVVGWCWYQPRENDVVIVQFDRPRIKRIKHIMEGNQVWVEGDNPDRSSDSRDLGSQPFDKVIAKVLFKL